MKGFPSREQVERIKAQYPEGTKICCEYMIEVKLCAFTQREMASAQNVFSKYIK